MPYREENFDSFVSDVFGRIMIPIMAGATSQAFPETIREQKRMMAMSTARTQLRRWKPATNEDKVSVAPSGFVFDLSESFTMRRVVNRFGKLGFRQAFQVQRLARNCAVLFNNRSRELMSEVSALVRDLFVLTSQHATGFGPVRAPLLPTGQPARGALDLAFGPPEEARVFGDAAIRVGGEAIKSYIDANCRFSFNCRPGQIRQVEFNNQRDMPTAGRAALECRAFQGHINCLRLPDGDPADFRNINAAIFKFNSLRNSERLMCAVFLLEFRETRRLLREVVKRPLAINEGLLQQLRIDLFQPLEARFVFQFGQFSRKLGPRDGFAGLVIGLFSTGQSPVEDEPSRARITGERHLLFGGRINPESVYLSFRHSISRPLRADVFGNRLLGIGGRRSRRNNSSWPNCRQAL